MHLFYNYPYKESPKYEEDVKRNILIGYIFVFVIVQLIPTIPAIHHRVVEDNPERSNIYYFYLISINEDIQNIFQKHLLISPLGLIEMFNFILALLFFPIWILMWVLRYFIFH